MKRLNIPKGGIKALQYCPESDGVPAFAIFLIAMPLCLERPDVASHDKRLLTCKKRELPEGHSSLNLQIFFKSN